MTITTVSEEILALDKALSIHKNAENAVAMSAYMKGHFPFLGVKSPERKEVQKKWICNLKTADLNRWDVIYSLWDKAEREYHYIAIDYLNRTALKDISINDHKYLEELLTTHSWWDSVDSIAANYVGKYFQKFPEQKDSIIRKWRESDDMWLNRTCIIFQLKYKDQVDFELLKDLIRQYQPVKEFFIQKAIGWSLRQYSKFNPKAVKAFIDEIGLEGLAKREGSKYV